MQSVKRNWYVVYTKPRWEKKLFAHIVEKGFEAYCPLNKVRKKWSDRSKWVEEPLFKSYVFVKLAEEEMGAVRQINGVVNFVYWLGKPAKVKEKEIEIIRSFLNEHEEVRIEPIELTADSRVTIRRGLFMDKEAKVIKVLNKKVQVIIESIGYTLIAILDRSNVAMTGK